MNIEFPISIALVGAPGSGKQPVLEAFAKLIESDPFWEGQTLTAINNTGGVIESVYDTPMGVFGDYKENLWAHFKRFETEEQHLRSGFSIITAGTIIENMAYGGVKIEDVRSGLQTPDIEMRLMKEMHATTVMSFLFADTFRYTFGFYLPLPESTIVIAGEDGGERAHATRIDQAIRVIFGNFGVRIQVLDQGSPEEKAEIMRETIERIMTTEVEEVASEPCPRCSSVDQGQTGEYPCPECGLPAVWDAPAEPNEVVRISDTSE